MKQGSRKKQGHGDYEPGQQSFMLFDGSDVPKADGCAEKRGVKTHSMHLGNTFEVDSARITQTAVCAYEGCKKEFAPTRSWQRFCGQLCRDEHWRFLRKQAMEEILKSKEV
jgi:hypothetical protein